MFSILFMNNFYNGKKKIKIKEDKKKQKFMKQYIL